MGKSTTIRVSREFKEFMEAMRREESRRRKRPLAMPTTTKIFLKRLKRR